MALAQSSLGEEFLWFSKNYLLWFNRIFLLFVKRKSCVFQIFLLRIKAYLCQNMIKFDSLDFSEHRPEEVISFFWRSVYYCITMVEPCAQNKMSSMRVRVCDYTTHSFLRGPCWWPWKGHNHEHEGVFFRATIILSRKICGVTTNPHSHIFT